MRRTSSEHSAEVLGQVVYTRFLDTATIESAALGVERRHGIECRVPVPVDDILERDLGFHLEFDDLRAYDALGATFYKGRTVVVDETLDPTEHPQMLGRYRFTISHEIGHITLHHAYLVGASETPDEPESQTGVGENFLDYQANQFAAFLLMPTVAVREAFVQATFGLPRLHSRDRVVRAMALKFQVSKRAMAIRLKDFDPPDEEIVGLPVPDRHLMTP